LLPDGSAVETDNGFHRIPNRYEVRRGLRFAIWQAGKQSARGPRYTVIPQRDRLRSR
jgi:hypothetical protein